MDQLPRRPLYRIETDTTEVLWRDFALAIVRGAAIGGVFVLIMAALP